METIDLMNNASLDDHGPSSKIQMFISCRNLKNLDIIGKSDPYCEVFLKNDDRTEWEMVGKTDTVINSLNPDFSKPITINYYFEKAQQIRFEIYDLDPSRSEMQGALTTKVSHLLGARNQTFVGDLENKGKNGKFGKIIVKADTVKDSNLEVDMTIQAVDLPSKKR